MESEEEMCNIILDREGVLMNDRLSKELCKELPAFIAYASHLNPKWSIEAHEFLCKYWNALKKPS
jgi:hypothetical protein